MEAAERAGRAHTMNDGRGEASKKTAIVCPCGDPLDVVPRRHIVCRECLRRVERHVERRFGRHRYGGRFARYVGDFVQDCYEKLYREGGIDRFVAPSDAEARRTAFRGWLWTVVHHHCNGVLAKWNRRLDDDQPHADEPPPPAPLTPEEALMHQYRLTLAQGCIEQVHRAWSARGRGDKFSVLIGFLCGDGSTYAQVAERLDVSVEHARVLVHELREGLWGALIAAVRATIVIPFGLGPASTRALIEDEVAQIMGWPRRPRADGGSNDGGF